MRKGWVSTWHIHINLTGLLFALLSQAFSTLALKIPPVLKPTKECLNSTIWCPIDQEYFWVITKHLTDNELQDLFMNVASDNVSTARRKRVIASEFYFYWLIEETIITKEVFNLKRFSEEYGDVDLNLDSKKYKGFTVEE